MTIKEEIVIFGGTIALAYFYFNGIIGGLMAIVYWFIFMNLVNILFPKRCDRDDSSGDKTWSRIMESRNNP
jgi:hypothetical protein